MNLVSGRHDTHQVHLNHPNSTLYKLASAAANPLDTIDDPILQYICARIVIYIASLFISYGVLNVLASLYIEGSKNALIKEIEVITHTAQDEHRILMKTMTEEEHIAWESSDEPDYNAFLLQTRLGKKPALKAPSITEKAEDTTFGDTLKKVRRECLTDDDYYQLYPEDKVENNQEKSAFNHTQKFTIEEKKFTAG